MVALSHSIKIDQDNSNNSSSNDSNNNNNNSNSNSNSDSDSNNDDNNNNNNNNSSSSSSLLLCQCIVAIAEIFNENGDILTGKVKVTNSNTDATGRRKSRKNYASPERAMDYYKYSSALLSIVIQYASVITSYPNSTITDRILKKWRERVVVMVGNCSNTGRMIAESRLISDWYHIGPILLHIDLMLQSSTSTTTITEATASTTSITTIRMTTLNSIKDKMRRSGLSLQRPAKMMYNLKDDLGKKKKSNHNSMVQGETDRRNSCKDKSLKAHNEDIVMSTLSDTKVNTKLDLRLDLDLDLDEDEDDEDDEDTKEDIHSLVINSTNPTALATVIISGCIGICIGVLGTRLSSTYALES